ADAAAWVVEFDPGEARAAGIKAILSTWAEQDLPASYAWIASIVDSGLRGEVINGMAESILEHPEADHENLLQSAPTEIRLRLEELKTQADGVSNEKN